MKNTEQQSRGAGDVGLLQDGLHTLTDEERSMIAMYRDGQAGEIISLLKAAGLLLGWTEEQNEKH